MRELKAENAKLKAENKALREENEMLLAHLELAELAAEDLRSLGEGGKLVIMDGWNLILGAGREVRSRDELIAKAKARLLDSPNDRVWIVFDGPKASVKTDGALRISYTGGVGEHRADKFICDFLKMARYRGDLSKIEVVTCDKDFKKEVSRIYKSFCDFLI